MLRVAVADCPREDGPRLQPLPIAKSRGDRSRRFPCKHAPVQLGLDGFDILYRLWTLPYNFLTRIVCATVSVIVRRRRGSPARVDNPTAPRSCTHLHTSMPQLAPFLHGFIYLILSGSVCSCGFALNSTSFSCSLTAACNSQSQLSNELRLCS